MKVRYCKKCDFYTDHLSTEHDGLAARGLLQGDLRTRVEAELDFAEQSATQVVDDETLVATSLIRAALNDVMTATKVRAIDVEQLAEAMAKADKCCGEQACANRACLVDRAAQVLRHIERTVVTRDGFVTAFNAQSDEEAAAYQAGWADALAEVRDEEASGRRVREARLVALRTELAAALGGEHRVPVHAHDGRQIAWTTEYVTGPAAEVLADVVLTVIPPTVCPCGGYLNLDGSCANPEHQVFEAWCDKAFALVPHEEHDYDGPSSRLHCPGRRYVT